MKMIYDMKREGAIRVTGKSYMNSMKVYAYWKVSELIDGLIKLLVSLELV